MTDNNASIFDELNRERYFDYATLAQRLLNALIDGIVILFIWMIVYNLIDICTILFWRRKVGDPAPLGISFKTVYLITLLYYFAMEATTKGRTIGKYITRTIVVDEDLSPVTTAQVFKRSCCRLIPFEALSMFSGIPWHDSLSRTTVIKKKKRTLA